MKRKLLIRWAATLCAAFIAVTVRAADKKPNILMLMEDDTGWNDFGCYNGGAALGHPTPNIDHMCPLWI